MVEQSSILESGSPRVLANFRPSTLPNPCGSSRPEFRAERSCACQLSKNALQPGIKTSRRTSKSLEPSTRKPCWHAFKPYCCSLPWWPLRPMWRPASLPKRKTPATACAAPRVEHTPRRTRIRRGLPTKGGNPARAALPAISPFAWGSRNKGLFTKLSRRCAQPCSPNTLPSPDRNFPARIRHDEKDSCSPVFSRRHSNLREASLLHATLKKRPPPRSRR